MMNEIIEFDLFSFLLGCFMTSVLCSVGFSLGVWAKRLNREIMQLEGGGTIELLKRINRDIKEVHKRSQSSTMPKPISRLLHGEEED